MATATLLISLPAYADDRDAAAQFDYGVTEMMAARYPTGCAALEGSFGLDPRPGTLFTLAECDRKWGHTAAALARYEQYLSLYNRMSPDQRAKQSDRGRLATEERRRLESSVPRLTVRLPDGAPADVVVERDDIVLGGPMLGAAVPVDPGDHVVQTKTADGRVGRETVTLHDGDSRVVIVSLPALAAAPPARADPAPAPAEPAAPPPEVRPAPSHRAWTLASLGVGATGLVVAAVTGGVALADKSTASAGCTAQGACKSESAASAGNTARTLANAETVALVVGGVGLAASLVLALTDRSAPKRSVSVGVDGTRAWVGGTF